MKRIITRLMAVLGRGADEDDAPTSSAEEIGTNRTKKGKLEEGQPQDFTLERAAELIDGMPSDVPRESVARIVRGALAAADIDVSKLERSTRARASKLSSEIELARNRQREFREKTEEAVHSLEEEIRKVREACNNIITEDEKNISRASAALKEVRRVRAFFDFPKTDGEGYTGPTDQDTQPLDAVRTQVGRHSDPRANTGGPTHYGAAEDSLKYGTLHGTSEER